MRETFAWVIPEHFGELRLGLAGVLAKLGEANRSDDRALACVDLSGGAGTLSDFLAQRTALCSLPSLCSLSARRCWS